MALPQCVCYSLLLTLAVRYYFVTPFYNRDNKVCRNSMRYLSGGRGGREGSENFFLIYRKKTRKSVLQNTIVGIPLSLLSGRTSGGIPLPALRDRAVLSLRSWVLYGRSSGDSKDIEPRIGTCSLSFRPGYRTIDN